MVRHTEGWNFVALGCREVIYVYIYIYIFFFIYLSIYLFYKPPSPCSRFKVDCDIRPPAGVATQPKSSSACRAPSHPPYGRDLLKRVFNSCEARHNLLATKVRTKLNHAMFVIVFVYFLFVAACGPVNVLLRTLITGWKTPLIIGRPP